MLFEEMSIDEIVAVRCEEAREEGYENVKQQQTQAKEIAPTHSAPAL